MNLSNRKIQQLLKGYQIVLNENEKKYKLLKDGKVVDTVSSFGLHHKVQAEVVFAERLQK